MQACIFDIKRFAIHDGPGIRVSIFFKGCPLHCIWCHNPEGIDRHPETYSEEQCIDGVTFARETRVGYYIGLEELCSEIEKDRVFMDETGGGVTFSGGEPLMQYLFLEAITEEMRKRGIHTCLDTSGYISKEIFTRIVKKTDLFLYDLKIVDDERHIKYTGVSNKVILKNLEILDKARAEVIIRIPFVPGINDGKKDIGELIGYLKGLEHIRTVELLPYHSWARNKYRRFNKENLAGEIRVPDNDLVAEAMSAFIRAGFNHVTIPAHERAH